MARRTFLERLEAGEVLITDGATGTNHQNNGLGAGVPPEDWVFDEPEKVVALHKAFIKAGADIILTNTFGGSPLRLQDSKYADQVYEINRRAAELARQAADEDGEALVGGSLGPTGQLLEPFGPLTAAEVSAAYAAQASALAEGGVDVFVMETFFAMNEALAAIEGIKQASDLPIVASFSYDQGVYTMMGLRASEVVEKVKDAGVTVIGANCGRTLDFMAEIVDEMVASEPGLPLWVKPNAGLPKAQVGPPQYDVGPLEMAEYAVRYVRAGAQIIGGCCGTSPEHLKHIADAVHAEIVAQT